MQTEHLKLLLLEKKHIRKNLKMLKMLKMLKIKKIVKKNNDLNKNINLQHTNNINL